MQTLTNFVVALPSEAKPIIHRLGLRPDEQTHGLRRYRRDNVQLVVSGVGKVASATAVGYIAGAYPPDTRHIWLNVGIAGHAHLPKGTATIAHRITDLASGSSFYPSIVFRPPCRTSDIVCHDEPTTSYASDAMCDMESSGFFAAASRFSTVEFVHALKVVSDNTAADIGALDRKKITALIDDNLDHIERLADTLNEIDANHLPRTTPLALGPLLERWHFTVTQRTQLRELARRWAVVRPEPEWPWRDLEHCDTSREVLARIGTALDQTKLQLGPVAHQ